MQVAIFGLGYVGLTSAACLVNDGFDVVGVDVSDDKVRAVNEGLCPIQEPGLAELLAKGRAEGRLRATTNVADAIAGTQVVIVCVGTPSAVDGSHNMSHIATVSQQIARTLAQTPGRESLTVLYRSTVRPGTIDQLVRPIFAATLPGEGAAFELVYNPEFLREATALKDYYSPPKIVIGTADGQPNAHVETLYAAVEGRRFYTRFREAEITKFIDNSFHALKVAFANELARVCRNEDIDVATVHEIFVSDTKLNISPYYLRPGSAFGGSCLPKDVRALTYISNEVGAETFIIDSIMRSNEAHKRFIFGVATEGLTSGSSVLLNGLAFKRNSDDLRESPNVDLARRLIQHGFKLKVWDPELKPEQLVGQNLGYSFAHLPELNALLLDAEGLAATAFDRIVDARGDAEEQGLGKAPIVRIDRL